MRPGSAGRVPRKWFDSEATAQRAVAERAVAEKVSAEAIVKLLSPGNLVVLDAIARHHPASIRELAVVTGRKEASLSRTLKRFVQAGIVGFEHGPRRTLIPVVIATRVHLEIDLVGHHSAVAVEAQH